MTDQTADLIQRYAAEIERIIDAGTAADHTWVGLLSAFMQEYAGDPVPALGAEDGGVARLRRVAATAA